MWWNEAQVNRDSGALERLVAEPVNTEYDGEVSDRSKFLADIRDPEFKPTFLPSAQKIAWPQATTNHPDQGAHMDA